MPTVEHVAEQVVTAMRDYIARAVKKVDDRLDAFGAQIERVPKEGPPGKDGEKGERGEKGDAGLPGKDVSLDDARPAIDEAVRVAVARMPAPKDGLPGKDGAPGKDVDPKTVNEIMSTLVEMRERVLELTSEIVELRGLPVAPASFLINEAGALVAVYPDGETKSIGQVCGEDGAAGATVMDGSVNADGALMLRMDDGRIINAGTVRGVPGKDGAKGERGRDANEVQILPGVDELKSYAEGTIAIFRGGLIRATRQTDPVGDDLRKAGWSVMLDGIADEHEEIIDDGRVIERSTTYTSGRTYARTLKTNIPRFLGVWREGSYTRHDIVQRQGSMWLCSRDTVTAPLPGAADWTLVTKKGADGKDGRDGKPGDRGPEGRSGRDLTQMAFDGRKF